MGMEKWEGEGGEGANMDDMVGFKKGDDTTCHPTMRPQTCATAYHPQDRAISTTRHSTTSPILDRTTLIMPKYSTSTSSEDRLLEDQDPNGPRNGSSDGSLASSSLGFQSDSGSSSVGLEMAPLSSDDDNRKLVKPNTSRYVRVSLRST